MEPDYGSTVLGPPLRGDVFVWMCEHVNLWLLVCITYVYMYLFWSFKVPWAQRGLPRALRPEHSRKPHWMSSRPLASRRIARRERRGHC